MTSDARIGELYRQKVKEEAALELYRLELDRMADDFIRIGNRMKRARSASDDARRVFSFPSDCAVNHKIRAISSTEQALREIDAELRTLTNAG